MISGGIWNCWFAESRRNFRDSTKSISCGVCDIGSNFEPSPVRTIGSCAFRYPAIFCIHDFLISSAVPLLPFGA